jgi:hypothetical protein
VTVDGSAVADRLRALVPPDSPAQALIDQLHDRMPDQEYAAVATAVVRLLASKREG